ncbi:Dps family protein [Eremococcus coleocola]|uniref:Ferritin-like protein n=1 Tax=Eremococcus coleocola ACS-139-V-Col8 TaxID=908337 RepID=E4KPY5_9LACT|nr:DNA starvation/stationary phase protection protein [Eremococcus coleocola]EFR31214.1 ferritin-like protein [Eremococcus coleocola ACS-139-V-Col8]
MADKKAYEVSNEVVATLGTLWTKLHQYHFYVQGPHFYSLHVKFEEMYDDIAEQYDDLAEMLLTMGQEPVATQAENQELSVVKENKDDKNLAADEMVANLLADYKATSAKIQEAMHAAQDDDESCLEDLLIEIKTSVDTAVWMLSAYLGKKVEK